MGTGAPERQGLPNWIPTMWHWLTEFHGTLGRPHIFHDMAGVTHRIAYQRGKKKEKETKYVCFLQWPSREFGRRFCPLPWLIGFDHPTPEHVTHSNLSIYNSWRDRKISVRSASHLPPSPKIKSCCTTFRPKITFTERKWVVFQVGGLLNNAL